MEGQGEKMKGREMKWMEEMMGEMNFEKMLKKKGGKGEREETEEEEKGLKGNGEEG